MPVDWPNVIAWSFVVVGAFGLCYAALGLTAAFGSTLAIGIILLALNGA